MADNLPGSDPSGLGEARAAGETPSMSDPSGTPGGGAEGRIRDLEKRITTWVKLKTVLEGSERSTATFTRALDKVEGRIRKLSEASEALRKSLDGAATDGGSGSTIAGSPKMPGRPAVPPSNLGASTVSATGQATQSTHTRATFSGNTAGQQAQARAGGQQYEVTSTERGYTASYSAAGDEGERSVEQRRRGPSFGGVARGIGVGIAAGVGVAAGYTFTHADAARQTDFLYQQVSFASGMGGENRDSIRQALFSGGAGRGTLGQADYTAGLQQLRSQGLITQPSLAAGVAQIGGVATIAPGLGSAGAASVRQELLSPQMLSQQLQLTGQMFDPTSTDPRQLEQIFRGRARAAGITNERQLQLAMTQGTNYNTYIRDLSPEAQTAFSEFTLADMRARNAGETLDLTNRKQLDRFGVTNNSLNTLLNEKESQVGRDLVIEEGLNDGLQTMGERVITANEAIRNLGLAHEDAARVLGNAMAQIGRSVESLASGSAGSVVRGLGSSAVGAFLGAGGGKAAIGKATSFVKNMFTRGGPGPGGGGGAGAVLRVGNLVKGAGYAAVGYAGDWIGRKLRDDVLPDGADAWLDDNRNRLWPGGPMAPSWLPGGGDRGDPHAGHNHGPAMDGMDPRMSGALAAMMRDNPRLQINSGHRSSKEQAALHASGQSPAAPGESFHERGLAADIGPSSEYGWLRLNASRYGLEGITESEPWHYELRGSRSPLDKHASISNEMRSRMGGGTPGTGGTGANPTMGAGGVPGIDTSEIPNFDQMTPEHASGETMTTLLAYLRGGLSRGEARVTSGYRPGSRTRGSGNPSNHSTGRALDVGGPGPSRRGHDDPGLRRVYDHFWKIRSHLRELILSGNDPNLKWVSAGSAYSPTRSGATWDDHWDHVHVSTHSKSLPGVVARTGNVASDADTPGVNFAPRYGDKYGQIGQAELIASIISGGGSVMGSSARNNSNTGQGVPNNLGVSGDIPGTILRVGKSLGATPQMLLAAMETGLVESGMRTGESVAYKDLDSIGVMQQRAAWANEPKDIPFASSKRNDPSWAARAFFMGGEGGQPGAFTEASKNHGTAGQLAQDVQVSAYPHKYNQRRDEAVSLAAQYGVDLSQVADPFPSEIVDMPLSAGGGPASAGSMNGQFALAPPMTGMGAGQVSRSYGLMRGGRGGGVEIHNLSMSVTLANGGREEVDRLFEELEDRAHSAGVLHNLGGVG